MILLSFPGDGEANPSYSPFCVKAMVWLQWSGLPFKVRFIENPTKLPHAKMPVVLDGDETISDSWQISRYLQKKTGKTLDKHLSSVDGATAHSVSRMVEEHLYFIIVLERWGNNDNFKLLKSRYFGSFQPLVRDIVGAVVRRNILRTAHGQGLGRMTEQERLTRAEADFDALSQLLGDGPWLFGQQASSVDFTVAPALASIISGFGQSAVREQLKTHQNLVDYQERALASLLPAALVEE